MIDMKFDICFNNIKNMQFNDYIYKFVVMLICLMRIVVLGYN